MPCPCGPFQDEDETEEALGGQNPLHNEDETEPFQPEPLGESNSDNEGDNDGGIEGENNIPVAMEQDETEAAEEAAEDEPEPATTTTLAPTATTTTNADEAGPAATSAETTSGFFAKKSGGKRPQAVDDGDDEGGESAGNLNFPINRIRAIMKLDPDTGKMGADAVFLVARTTELFVQYLADKAFQVTQENRRKTIQKKDILSTVQPATNLEFLESNFTDTTMDEE